MDLEYLFVSLYVPVDEWWQETHPPTPKKAGRPPSLSASEVLTLAVLTQWPRWRSERDFWRFADVHLRGYFPNLLSHGQLNRRIRALEPVLRALQRDLARTYEGHELAEALRSGDVKIEGDESAVARFVTLFPLPEPAAHAVGA